jgi:MFS transporter, MHS family, proline/betaine transporter
MSDSQVDFSAPDSTSPHGRKTLRRAIAASAMGNATEWFDYGVYAVAATYITANFFPGDSGAGTVWTLATFALSFLVRPLGGLFWGPLGDRIGRKRVLALTIILMAGATFAIGLLPTYAMTGVLAPALLIALRMLQGFSTGGEYGGAAVFMAEYAPDRRRGFFGAFLEFGTLAGTSAGAVLCTVLILLVGDDGMLAGWWRLPFLLTLPLGLVALWLRVRLQEPPVFAEAEQHHETSKRPLRDLVRSYWRQILVLMGFVVLLNVAYYLILAYMPTYLSANLGLSTAQGNLMLVGIMLAMMCFINPLGALSDRIGRKPLLITAAVGYMVLSVPAFLLINTNSLVLQIIGLAILGLFLVILIGSVSSTLPALFPTKVRYSGFAIGYNISTAIFGGTAAAVNAALIESTGSNLVPGWYLTAAGAIGLVAILCMRETARCSLRGNHIPGTDAAENAAIKADKEVARA